jgi:hypothetical protein
MVAVGKFGVENHAKVFDPNFTKYIKILNWENTSVVVTPQFANIMMEHFPKLIFNLYFLNQGSNNLMGLFNFLVACSVFSEGKEMHILNTQGKGHFDLMWYSLYVIYISLYTCWIIIHYIIQHNNNNNSSNSPYLSHVHVVLTREIKRRSLETF